MNIYFMKLKDDICNVRSFYSGDDMSKHLTSLLTGKINFAAEANLITFDQWWELFMQIQEIK